MENVNPNPQGPARRVYAMNHPALPPLVSQFVDVPAVAVNRGSRVQNHHTNAASLQHKHRKTLLEANLATVDEVAESRKRKALLLVDSFFPLPVGEDGVQLILQRIQANNEDLRDMNRQMGENNAAHLLNNAALNQRMDRIGNTLVQLTIHTARNSNRTLATNETIAPVPNNFGVLPFDVEPDPIAFPQTLLDLAGMDEPHVNALLIFYGILAQRRATPEERKALLRSHLGFLRS